MVGGHGQILCWVEISSINFEALLVTFTLEEQHSRPFPCHVCHMDTLYRFRERRFGRCFVSYVLIMQEPIRAHRQERLPCFSLSSKVQLRNQWFYTNDLFARGALQKKTQRKRGMDRRWSRATAFRSWPTPVAPMSWQNLPVKTAALAGADETIIFLRSCCHLTHVLVRWTAGQVRSHSHVQYFLIINTWYIYPVTLLSSDWTQYQWWHMTLLNMSRVSHFLSRFAPSDDQLG